MARGEPAHAARRARARNRAPAARARHLQSGAALLVTLALLGLIVVGYLLTTATGTETEAEKERRTADALAQAKEALIGYALARNLAAGAGPGCLAVGDDPRPGDLPCPDTDNDGSAVIVATGTPEVCSGNATNARLGRLPWRTLGLPDLRDGDGERLWYAISDNFKNSPQTTCTNPEDSGCLNSNSQGTISIRDAQGNLVHTDVVAVIIAPGPVLQRQGAGVQQNRDATGPGANLPINYLDVALGIDNAAFTDAGGGGVFIAGPVPGGGTQPIVNDRILAVTLADIMPAVERRVAREARACLSLYASQPQNRNRLPWAADVMATGTDGTATYADAPNTRVGRFPDSLSNSRTGSGNAMTANWPNGCTLQCGTWWRNWKQLVFYSVAGSHEPVDPLIEPALCSGGSCLAVQSAACGAGGASASNAGAVVIVAGRVIGAQGRGSQALRQDPRNYLEAENDWTAGTPCLADVFTRQPANTAFNDSLEFKGP